MDVERESLEREFGGEGPDECCEEGRWREREGIVHYVLLVVDKGR